MIVYDGEATVQGKSSLQQEYLDAVQQAFDNQSQHGNIIGLQWINVKLFRDIQEPGEEDNWADQEFKEQILKAVDIATEVRIWDKNSNILA